MTAVGLTACLSVACCSYPQLMYPLARAFGSPPESELVQCRNAFRQLQVKLETSRLEIQPVLFVAGGDGRWHDGSQQWSVIIAQEVATEMAKRTKANLVLVTARPNVDFPGKMYHNQLQYLWDRAEQYSQWVKASRPSADYVLIIEMFSGAGKKEAAAQLYVIDASGQIAISRLMRFPGAPASDKSILVKPIINALFDSIRMDANALFPPYGVG